MFSQCNTLSDLLRIPVTFLMVLLFPVFDLKDQEVCEHLSQSPLCSLLHPTFPLQQWLKSNKRLAHDVQISGNFHACDDFINLARITNILSKVFLILRIIEPSYLCYLVYTISRDLTRRFRQRGYPKESRWKQIPLDGGLSVLEI